MARRRYFNKHYHPPGTAPGTLTDRPGASAPQLNLTRYDGRDLHQTRIEDAADLPPAPQGDHWIWLRVEQGINAELLQTLRDRYQLHPLALEDVLNGGQYPKLDEYENHLFLIAALPVMENGTVTIRTASLFLGKNLLISLHSDSGGLFEPILKRLQAKNGQIKRQGIEFLAYALIDRIVDEGFPLLEQLGETMEQLETALLEQPQRETLEGIHHLRQELLILRRVLWPQRQMISRLLQDETVMPPALQPYWRDCYDHSLQIIELLEVYREMTAGMLDIYLSSMSYRLNDVMRVLTIIATLFIPPTFIVGVYGMNFDRTLSDWNMPELGWRYGYLVVWLIIAASIGSLLLYFRRKRWI